MKRNIKVILALILVLVSGFLILKSDYIVAFAKSLYAYDYEYDKVYSKGDEVILYTDSNNYVPYVFVGYEDKDGKLLDFHSVDVFSSSGVSFNSFSIGDSCIDVYHNNPYYGFLCDNSSRYNMNYNEYEDEMKVITNWKLVENTGRSIRYYCGLYDFDNYLCDYVINLYSSGYTEYEAYPVLMFKEYVVPTFELTCETNEIQYGEKVKCQLSVNTDDKVVSIKTNLANDYLVPSNITAKNGWTYEKDKDGYYVIKNDSAITGSQVVLDFVMVAQKNVTVDTSVSMVEFEYTTDSGFSQNTNLESKIKIQAVVNNPNTSDFRLIVLFLVSVFAVVCGLILYKKKRFLE